MIHREISIDDSHVAARLTQDQWQTLIALHRTLHAHYDFFLTSQHPAASAALRQLASRYVMPVRIFEDPRVDCLGNLARCRMAIEANDLKNREMWTKVARQWYSFASKSLHL
ncbi:unnamed protein product [Clonostachys chloroleuca]|uniref:Uncharacterized protein n=1 Tax=Clonostachys chloroleuca TaxID=1926264 RepID=A0AA35LPY0_9HYPO|nr:unnamed protein product [Clonostachys chloroleuca]